VGEEAAATGKGEGHAAELTEETVPLANGDAFAALDLGKDSEKPLGPVGGQ